jgi:UDP-N-acetyl-D-glucosamine dehydrogenase
LSKAFYSYLAKTIILVSSPKVAEAAKLLQNAFRLVNISFVNEMKIMFEHMGIDIWEVIEAARTKPFGFTPFYPGPGIGGDCIPIGPHYLVLEGQETHGPTEPSSDGKEINDQIITYVVGKIEHALNVGNKPVNGSKILILGVAFKKEVNDIRESCSLKIIEELLKKGGKVLYNDPMYQRLEAIL